jgi:hypothetical protein
MFEQAEIPVAIVESIGDDSVGETVDEGSAEGFIATLPFSNGVQEEVGGVHASCYTV